MKVDNFDKIKQLLHFEDKDDFYFLQIIQRKKDGCNVNDSGNNGYRKVKTYYISSIEELERRREKIIELCENNNARAYIHLNVRSAREVALNAAKTYIDLVREDRCNQGYRVYDHACGVSPKMGVKKKWIIDVDDLTNEQVEEICNRICRCRSAYKSEYGDNFYENIIARVQTAHGEHIITHGFDAGQFKTTLFHEREAIGLNESQVIEICDIKKDGPTLLYFNNKQ